MNSGLSKGKTLLEFLSFSGTSYCQKWMFVVRMVSQFFFFLPQKKQILPVHIDLSQQTAQLVVAAVVLKVLRAYKGLSVPLADAMGI